MAAPLGGQKQQFPLIGVPVSSGCIRGFGHLCDSYMNFSCMCALIWAILYDRMWSLHGVFTNQSTKAILRKTLSYRSQEEN